MKVQAIVTVRRTARVVEEGVMVMEQEVAEEPEDRDGDTIEEWVGEHALATYIDGTVDVAWSAIESWDHETRVVSVEIVRIAKT